MNDCKALVGGCSLDLKCGANHSSAVCPRGMTCRAAACMPTAHDDGGTLASLLGNEAGAHTRPLFDSTSAHSVG